MAITNTFGTANPGAQIGNREDLASGISMLEPEVTPVYNTLSKPALNAMEFSWLVDDLAPVGTASTPEGAPVLSVDDKFVNQARLYNNVHKLRKTYAVTSEQQAVDSAGPVSYERAQLKATKEIKRDMEAVILGAQDKAAQGGANAAWQTRGFADWIDSAGPVDVPAAYRTPAASIHVSGAYLEANLQAQLASIFDQTGSMTNMTLIASSALRRTMNNFFRQEGTTTARSYQVTEDAKDYTVTLNVEVFDSSFGKISIANGNPRCFASGVNGYLINPEFAQVGNLIPLGAMDLPEDGSGQRGCMEVVFGTKCLNPKAHGLVRALS
jgi:hypothetical protein